MIRCLTFICFALMLSAATGYSQQLSQQPDAASLQKQLDMANQMLAEANMRIQKLAVIAADNQQTITTERSAAASLAAWWASYVKGLAPDLAKSQ